MVPHQHGWFEYTTLGAVYVLTCVLLGLQVLGIHDLSDIGKTLRDYATYIVPLALAASYLAGRTASNVISLASAGLPERLRWFIRGHKEETLVDDPGWPRRVKLLNRGSPELINYISEHYSVLILLRSMVVALPAFTFSLVWWGRASALADIVTPIGVAGAVLSVVVFVAHREQYRRYFGLIAAAKDEIESTQEKYVTHPTSNHSKGRMTPGRSNRRSEDLK